MSHSHALAQTHTTVARATPARWLTGVLYAGTGKSYLLKAIVAHLKAAGHTDDTLFVTASTGIAAVAIGGTTVHKFAGFGLGKGPIDAVVGRVIKSDKARERWRGAKVLVIDEISMLDEDMFTKLDAIGRATRRDGRPFGGLQLVVSGDFAQLPPVSRSFRDPSTPAFAFLSPAWDAARFNVVVLTEVVRQKDEAFVRLLNEVRGGHVSAATEATMRSLSRPLPTANGVLPTRLHCTNRNVDEENSLELQRLAGAAVTIVAVDQGQGAALEALGKFSQSPKELTLKVGAQVGRSSGCGPRFSFSRRSFALCAHVLCPPSLPFPLSAPGPRPQAVKSLTHAHCPSCRLARLQFGALQVVLVRNRDDRLVNGSRGVVVAFEPLRVQVSLVSQRGLWLASLPNRDAAGDTCDGSGMGVRLPWLTDNVALPWLTDAVAVAAGARGRVAVHAPVV